MAETQQSQVGWNQVSLSVFSGMKYSLALVLIALVLLAVLYMVGWDWMTNDQTVYAYINYAAVMLGGFIAGNKLKTKGWLLGILLAVVYWVFLLLLTKPFGVQITTLQQGLIRMGIAALLGAVGGMIGVNV